MSRVLPLLLCVVLVSCAGGGENLTETGKGYPRPSIAFPAASEPGSVQDAVLRIENPGPGDIPSLLVTFLQSSPAAPGEPLPTRIARGGPEGKDKALVSVTPEPAGVDAAGVVYRFGPLPEGEDTTITFRFKVPQVRGPAGNSVLVSDGQDIERARGVRMQTEVGG